MLNESSSSGKDLADRTLADGEVMRRIQARDEAAFELLFERYRAALNRYICSIVRGEIEAEPVAQDLVQETFLRVWTRAEQWSGQGSLKSWLYRIATNLALNHLRSRQRHPFQLLPGEDSGPWDEWSQEEEGSPAPGWLVDTSTLGPDALLEQAEESARLRQAIDRLPEEKREVFRLVHEMELSIRDAAGRLGIPEGTVKSRLFYAEKRFNQAWNEQDTDE
jgi:RNA polymerase sigma-70 factor (ECF subfamily)